MSRAALGFRTHSGWAAMVAVTGTSRQPRVIDRRRIIIADPETPGSKQPYHAAADLPFAEAELLVRTSIESSRAWAREAVSAAVEALRSRGYQVTRCGLLTGSGRELPELENILASHALIHTAEGEMFRDAVAWAARACGLSLTTVREKELTAESLRDIASLGKQIGPPWTQDQTFATVAAILALHTD